MINQSSFKNKIIEMHLNCGIVQQFKQRVLQKQFKFSGYNTPQFAADNLK
jgi:hypothetical protein